MTRPRRTSLPLTGDRPPKFTRTRGRERGSLARLPTYRLVFPPTPGAAASSAKTAQIDSGDVYVGPLTRRVAPGELSTESVTAMPTPCVPRAQAPQAG